MTTTAEGYVLDARQGKTLNDKFSNYVPTANIKNNLTTTDSDYVLDARQGKALNDKIADKMNKASSFSISASSNKTFNIGNSFRGVFFVIGGASNAQDVITVYSTSSGSVAYQKMGSSSNITITTGTGSFKIANAMTSAVYVYVMIFNGSVS